MLIEVWIIDGVDSVDIFLVLIVGRLSYAETDERPVLKFGVDETDGDDEDIEGDFGILVDLDEVILFV